MFTEKEKEKLLPDHELFLIEFSILFICKYHQLVLFFFRLIEHVSLWFVYFLHFLKIFIFLWNKDEEIWSLHFNWKKFDWARCREHVPINISQAFFYLSLRLTCRRHNDLTEKPLHQFENLNILWWKIISRKLEAW